jgi:hypothetical protein
MRDIAISLDVCQAIRDEAFDIPVAAAVSKSVRASIRSATSIISLKVTSSQSSAVRKGLSKLV